MRQIKISNLKLLEILNRIPFFNQFTLNERETFLTSSLVFLQCRSNEHLIREGDEDTSFYIILAGTARVLVDQGTKQVAVLGPGYFIGEGAFVMNRPRTATIKAQTEVFMVQLDQQSLKRFPASVREKLKDQIINGMALRLADMNEQLVSTVNGT